MTNMIKERVLSATLREAGLEREALFSGSRLRRICDARNMAILIMHHHFSIGVKEISDFFRRDLSTTCKNLKSASDLVAVDQEYQGRVKRIIDLLSQ